MTESPASPATHALQRSSDERVVDDDGPLDAPTLAALRHAHQRHGVAIAIGTAGPVGLGLLLLLLANTGVVAVPLAALVATCAMAVVAACFDRRGVPRPPQEFASKRNPKAGFSSRLSTRDGPQGVCG
jgi:hypothetical protein